MDNDMKMAVAVLFIAGAVAGGLACWLLAGLL